MPDCLSHIRVLCAAVIAAPFLLHADTTTVDTAGLQPLDKMIVTATRRETEIGKAPSIGTVIGKEDIEATQAAHPSDVMKYAPGLSVEGGTMSGGPQKRNAAINGMPSFYNVVMLDGMRLVSSHMQTGTNVDLIPAAAVERIEIIRDASSAQYGSDALGGVINVITSKGAAAPDVTVGASLGSNHLKHIVGSSRGSMHDGAAAYSVLADFERSDGVAIEEPARRANHLEYRKISLINRFDLNPVGPLDVTGYINYITYDAEFSDSDAKKVTNTKTAAGADTILISDDFDMQTALLFNPGLRGRVNITDAFSLESMVYYTHWQAEISTEFIQIFSPRLSADLKGLRGNEITLGVEYLWRNYARSGVPDTNDQHMVSAYVQDNVALLDSSLIALAALRLDYVANTGDGAENTGPVASPKLSLLYRPVKPLAIRATVGTGVKAPTVMELYEFRSYAGIYRLGNPKLESEHSVSLAGGVQVTPNKHVGLAVNGYGNFMRDMIVLVANGTLNGRPRYDRFNLDKGTIGGLDASANFSMFGFSLDVGGSTVFQSSGDDSLRIPYEPGQTAYGRLSWSQTFADVITPSLFVGMRALRNRSYWDFRANEVNELADMNDMEIGCGVGLSRAFEACLKMSNLLGENQEMYEDVLWRTKGERQWEVGVRGSM